MNDIEILEEFIKNYKEVQERYKDDKIQAEIERSCYFEEVPAEAIENLIKENTKLRIQISARETVVDELTKENKELKEKINKSIEFINDDDTFFNDGENWQNVLHIERILKGE